MHPLRVMQACRTGPAQIVAVLHDVIEDTDWTIARLRMEGFDESILAALDAVTKRDGEEYQDFVSRAAQNSIAREVKLADIRDNMDLTRIANPTERDRHRIERYKSALGLLTSDMHQPRR